jgi:DNA-binding CsgD family transcriptional regulator
MYSKTLLLRKLPTRSVAQGQATCPSTLCRVLFDHVANSASWQPGIQVRQNLGLTRREQQLVQLVSEGLTNKEIATRLFLSEQTVKNHVRRMLRKAGAADRLEAVQRWRERGFCYAFPSSNRVGPRSDTAIQCKRHGPLRTPRLSRHDPVRYFPLERESNLYPKVKSH